MEIVKATKNYRDGLPPMPDRIKSLDVDPRGYPIPWFVTVRDGVADFRFMDPVKLRQAFVERRCWVCGGRMGVYNAFLIGPMCAVNRVSSEPPSHLDCAEFSVQACPFLSNPSAHRRTANTPADVGEPAGIAILHNPGVSLIWVTKEYVPIKVHNGVLFRLGDPTDITFWKQSRKATFVEVMAALELGLPKLIDAANVQGPKMRDALDGMIRRAVDLMTKFMGPDSIPLTQAEIDGATNDDKAVHQ